MSKNKSRGRRKRRQNKQVLRFGRKSKPKHMLKTGRTGSVHSKYIKTLISGRGETVDTPGLRPGAIGVKVQIFPTASV